MYIPKTALNGHFSQKNVTSILPVGPITRSVFVSELELFGRGSPFFVLKIFTRPSVVLCLSLTTVLACHYLDYLYFFHHWTPWNCIRRTNSLPKKSFSNLPGKDGRAFSLVPGIHPITSFFLSPCIYSFNVKASEFDFNKPFHQVHHWVCCYSRLWPSDRFRPNWPSFIIS